jgi:exonuclease SbcC
MKIKKVEIAGFRAYQRREDGTFDFTLNSGEVANFVSIYAPNGFGKSSFYDAVEWAITNNISRFTRDSLRNNNNNISKHLNSGENGQRILRNRYISDDDESYVLIETTLANTTFNRLVRKAGAGQRDYTFDLKSIEQDTQGLTNIFLSQDAIDAFLKEDTPEARYEKFMAHFGGDDEQYRIKLNALSRTCAKELKLLIDQQKKLEENLSKNVVLEAFEHVNETIHRLMETGESQFGLLSPDTINETTDTLYRNYLVQGQQRNSNAINLAKEKLVLIEECITSLPNYIQNKNSAKNIKTQLDILQKNQQMLDKREQSIGLIAEYEARLSIFLKEKEDIDFHKENLSIFAPEQRKLNDYKEIRSNFIREKSTIATQLAENKQSFQDKLLIISEINIDCEKYQKYINDAADIFNQIDRKLSRQFELTDEIAKNKTQLGAFLSQKQELESTRNIIINMVVDQNVWRLNEYSLLDTPEKLTINLTNCLERIDVLRTEAEKNKIKLEKLGVLQGDIGKLVNIGKELLGQTHSDTCPLCSHKHESYENLITKIINNSGLSQQQQDIGTQLEGCEREFRQQTDALTKLLTDIEELKKAKFLELTTKLNGLDEGILQSENRNFNFKHAQEQLENDLHELKLKTQGMSFQNYIQYCEEQIASLRLKKTELENAIVKLKNDELELTHKIANISTELARVDASINHIETSDITLAIQGYLTRNLVPKDTEELFITQKSTELELVIKQLQSDIEQTKAQLALHEQLITSNNGLFNREQLLTQAEDKRRQIQELNNEIMPFMIKLKELQVNSELTNEAVDVFSKALSQLRISMQAAINIYYEVEMLLNVLSKQLTDVLDLTSYTATKKELTITTNQLVKYSQLNQKLHNEIEVIGSRLKLRIDSFFYTELINIIYSKIDPHPFFKNVSFECVFPSDSNSKPRLEVYLYEEGNNRPIAPSLFFSAAQLNVLSLSIFLARALHVEYKGSPVQTILIDDPIHTMDSINILSTIDLLRNISEKFDRQIILSTHDENFHELLKMKIPPQKYASKFMKLESFGKVTT